MKENPLAALPRVDMLLAHPALAESGLPYALRLRCARRAVEEARDALRSGARTAPPAPEELARRALQLGQTLSRPALGRVVNATGVVLHTNLGRAPLSPRAAEAVAAVSRGYSNLEYDLDTGGRGSRGAAAEGLLARLTGAESALVVNNNAAAVLLMLSVLARDRGVAIARGELVEIGGSFRVPDIMVRGGARLVEVGTTNKTRPADYDAALTDGRAQVLLKVHPSNFKVVGFTRETSLEELGELARRRGAPLLCDLGSGALDRRGPWPADYPTAAGAAALADVVSFSADKLLGGPQAGVLVGKKELIDRLRRDPLTRALRLDKLSLAALEATLLDWRDGVFPPAPAMLARDGASLREQAAALAERLAPRCPCELVPLEGEAGGGSLPGETLPGWGVALDPAAGARALEAFLRRWDPPVLGRIHRDRLLLDVRTLLPGDEADILAALAAWEEGAP